MSIASSFSPEIKVHGVPIPAGVVHVVRDDVLPGGTKQRAAVPYLRQLTERGSREFVYASPFSGFAQVALAVACREIGVRCRVFAERDSQKSGEAVLHPYSVLARSFGSEVTLCESLAEAESLASAHAARSNPSFKIPLGFDDPRFVEALKSEVGPQLDVLARKLGRVPERVWLPVGSGTLARAFRSLLGNGTTLVCVNVRVLPAGDRRISMLSSLPDVSVRTTEELFQQRQFGEVPPVPSNPFYDAKLWRHIVADGRDGDVWWNVAR